MTRAFALRVPSGYTHADLLFCKFDHTGSPFSVLDAFQMFHRCQRIVQAINAKSRLGSDKEQKLAANIVGSLARSIQDTSIQFKKSQSTYLRSKGFYVYLTTGGIKIAIAGGT